MRLKVANLEGAALDVAVALAEGWEEDRPQDRQMKKRGIVDGCGYHNGYSYAICAPRPAGGMMVGHAPHWSPSTMWQVGGPIIHREWMSLECRKDGKEWFARIGSGGFGTYHAEQRGRTALVAAMRAYVESVFGATIDLPNTGVNDALEVPEAAQPDGRGGE